MENHGRVPENVRSFSKKSRDARQSQAILQKMWTCPTVKTVIFHFNKQNPVRPGFARVKFSGMVELACEIRKRIFISSGLLHF